MRISSGGSTDVGRVRSNNEDSYRIVEPLNLFVLSDGMGGEAHGEVASAIAVDTIADHCLEAAADHDAPFHGQPLVGWSDHTKRLASAVYLANQKIFAAADRSEERHGMGATLTAVWIGGNRMSLAHVGDSRAYLLRSGNLQQLTTDHSLVAEQVRRGILSAAEAERSDMQNVLLRALGTQEEVEFETDEHQLIPNDALVICSDGLTRMVTEPEIAGTLQAETDPQKAAEQLVNLANENGGADNITVIVVRLEPDSSKWFSWLRGGARKSKHNGNKPGGH
ncbi:MAG TPA: Stp1/IreP family PP2C-type Ser/Thr phosphatase [Methylomirabilota bacterium]|nr:Stp1/IreP family PP2C-type Ser/Thr phosphatase [Methylomirabilota bacterium]